MWSWLKSQSDGPRTLGQIGEELAQLEYKNRGYKIVAANFFNKKGKRLGEIDFIAQGKEEVIFVEVKTRTEEKGFHGTPQESVDHFKQVKLLKAVKIFLQKYPEYQKFRPQIDVCVIIIPHTDPLYLAEFKPAKYLVPGGVDKLPHSATIIANAVEDWG